MFNYKKTRKSAHHSVSTIVIYRVQEHYKCHCSGLSHIYVNINYKCIASANDYALQLIKKGVGTNI